MLREKPARNDVPAAILYFVFIAVYIAFIVYFNFSGNPSYYDTDMYMDLNYAVQASSERVLFPNGWVFGNTVYAASTPVLASLFYGLTANRISSMGLASTLMTLFVLASLRWMLLPVFKKASERLLCIAVFMSLPLFFGDAVNMLNGWQLYFTMCSYYSFYLVALFLAFGCFLRVNGKLSADFHILAAITCALSFAAGIQSLRQTAVMVCPLVAAALIRIIINLKRGDKPFDKSVLFAVLVSVFNIGGLIFVRVLHVEQYEIFGPIGFKSLSEMLPAIIPSFSNAAGLFFSEKLQYLLFSFSDKLSFMPALSAFVRSIAPEGVLMTGIMAVVILAVLLYVIIRLVKTGGNTRYVCLVLLLMSALVITAIDVMTTMSVRGIYYFMLIPLLAAVITTLYSEGGKGLKIVILILAVLLFAFNLKFRLYDFVTSPEDNTDYAPVVACLEENGIDTVYSRWNMAEKVSIESDWSITAGFWGSPSRPFESVRYLGNMRVFDSDSARCAYLLNADEAAVGLEAAKALGADLTLLASFEDIDLLVYTSDTALMH